MRKYLVTAPTVEPLEIDELGLHLRLSDDALDTEGALLSGLIMSARQQAEKILNRVLITQTWEMKLSRWWRYNRDPYFTTNYGPNLYWPNPREYQAFNGIRIELPVLGVQSVTSITYIDPNQVTQTLAPNQYQLAGQENGSIIPAYGVTWPDVLPFYEVITVRWVAGYGDAAADVPQPIKQWMLLQIGNMYENREAMSIGQIVSPLPFADGLLAPYILHQA